MQSIHLNHMGQGRLCLDGSEFEVNNKILFDTDQITLDLAVPTCRNSVKAMLNNFLNLEMEMERLKQVSIELK